MSQESVERFLGRIITDDDFRRMAMGSMKLAMASNDLTFTDEEMDSVSSVDWDIIELASSNLDKAIKRSSVSSVQYTSVEAIGVGR